MMTLGAFTVRLPAEGWKPAGWDPERAASRSLVTRGNVTAANAVSSGSPARTSPKVSPPSTTPIPLIVTGWPMAFEACAAIVASANRLCEIFGHGLSEKNTSGSGRGRRGILGDKRSKNLDFGACRQLPRNPDSHQQNDQTNHSVEGIL